MEFLDLISLFEASGWQALGKIPNPVTGKCELDLKAAENAIEILILLREKSRNNLSQEEESQLSTAIANLQLNYAVEKEKAKLGGEEKKEEALRENL